MTLQEWYDFLEAVIPAGVTTFFFLFFVGILIYVYTDKRKRHIHHMEHMPLDDGLIERGNHEQ